MLGRILLGILGVELIFYGIFAMRTLGLVLTLVRLVPLANGLMGSCTLYTVFKTQYRRRKILLLDW
jgi:hypothetical protein